MKPSRCLWSLLVLFALLGTGCASEITSSIDHRGDVEASDTSPSGADTVDRDTVSTGVNNIINNTLDTRSESFCGDDNLDGGEACDNGAANSDNTPDACRSDCTLPRCGDGVGDSGEECDDGVSNSDTIPDACRTTCRYELSTCGNGVRDLGEACDDGASNSDSDPDACREDCNLPRCGDGATDTGEGCDDGNNTDIDACSNNCVPVWSHLCVPCEASDECGRAVDVCQQHQSGDFCATSCSVDDPDTCPGGYECQTVQEGDLGLGFCVPLAGDCSEVCGNGLDDDGDGLIDCLDTDCSSTEPRCCDDSSGAACGTLEFSCNDGFDNDSDGLIDCLDDECFADPACQEDCDDGVDNDLDGDIDCDDADCDLDVACLDPCESATCSGTPDPSCDNLTNLTTFSAVCDGSSGVAVCSYPGSVAPCGGSLVCNNGQCLTACETVTCDATPPSGCFGSSIAQTFSGICVNVGTIAECSYPSIDIDCSLLDQICLSGSCVPASSAPRPNTPGDMIFTEVMPYPNRSRQLGQWFEIYNNSAAGGSPRTFNLEGCYVYDSNQSFEISVTSGTLVAAPGEYVTFAPSLNPGFISDFKYSSSSFELKYNASDTLRLSCNSVDIDLISFVEGSRGFSQNLSLDAYGDISNDNLSNWCTTGAGTYTSDPSEWGTPGMINPVCL